MVHNMMETHQDDNLSQNRHIPCQKEGSLSSKIQDERSPVQLPEISVNYVILSLFAICSYDTQKYQYSKAFSITTILLQTSKRKF